MKPRSFRSAAAFHDWLGRNHALVDALVVRCFKVHARARGLTYREALDEALCYGWIDGVRNGLDADSYTVRFTPRRPRSIWSAVNIRRANELRAEGRMQSPGLAAFEARSEARSRVYSFESPKPVALPAEYEARFRADAGAWADFTARPPWYRRTSSFWVMSAKRDETRDRRLATLIDHSARGLPIPPLARPPRSSA